MKKLLLFVSVVAFLASCGKKSEHLKEEKELNQKLMDMHHEQMAVYYQVDSLVKVLDTKAADTTLTAQANLAKVQLVDFKKHMDEWMGTYEMYDNKLEHEKAMQKLEKDKVDLETMSAEMQKALDEANKILK